MKIYYVGFSSSLSMYQHFNFSVINTFQRLKIPIECLPPCDWSNNMNQSLEAVERAASEADDIWFISYAQNPVIDVIKDKPGKKVTHLHSSSLFPYEPSSKYQPKCKILEIERLKFYDLIFVTSEWVKENLLTTYPSLADKVKVTGIPLSKSFLSPYIKIKKQPNLVVFIDKFDDEHNQMIEIELGRRLVEKGYEVVHLSEYSIEQLSTFSKYNKGLINIAQHLGMTFMECPSPKIFYENLAKAAFLCSATLTYTINLNHLSSLYLGVLPIWPNRGSFKEILTEEDLYPPYNLEKMMDKILHPVRREADLSYHSAKRVISRYLEQIQSLS
ncbi:glycosyltransferase family 4 protein [Microaerobacter geothermalis]|uniref:glycosyltransferase family 4 protein n=1 Tax=Microaerobacter geothermalis TaxID=674972 RepID=UPI001F2ED3D7|nr:glycosyltransferase family 4 protein [Microaerobacter geothermalis]MCF6093313.1 glycosyltransferase family 4 protein [Microaerobacter geothermalis]